MSMIQAFRGAAIAAALLLALPASAAPDAEAQTTFAQADGLYTAVKTVQVFSDTNPDNPMPVAGSFTYVYTITNQPSSLIGLIGFDIEVPADSVSQAGFFDGAGVEPTAILVGSLVVEFDFGTPIAPGQTSEELFVISTFQPGAVEEVMRGENDASVGGEFGFDTPGTCLGPAVPPEFIGEPLPCTIGFWKNRAAGKKGLLKFFPDPDFDGLVTDAVALSGAVFADEAALLSALGSKGRRTLEERGRQQLAALLLNLAAGDAFPDNQKCRLFEGNFITSNECGDQLTVGQALETILLDVGAGHSCTDDINNGIGVVQ